MEPNSLGVAAPAPRAVLRRYRAKDQSLQCWGCEENYKSEPPRSDVRERKSSSVQVVDGGLPAQEPVGVYSGGLGQSGRAQEKSFWR